MTGERTLYDDKLENEMRKFKGIDLQREVKEKKALDDNLSHRSKGSKGNLFDRLSETASYKGSVVTMSVKDAKEEKE